MKNVIVIVLLWCLALPALAEDDAGRLTVSGTGYATGAPDMATLTLGVTQQEKTAGEALAAASAATSKILEALKAAGIADKDMQTSQLTLNPQWNYRNSSGQDVNEITGYVASNLLNVRIREIGEVGAVLDRVAQSGANEFRGLSFGFAEPQGKEDEARIAAIKDARRKADLMAEAAGVTLARIVSISEAGGQGRPIMMAEARMAADSAVPVASGEVSLQSTVTLVFELGD